MSKPVHMNMAPYLVDLWILRAQQNANNRQHVRRQLKRNHSELNDMENRRKRRRNEEFSSSSQESLDEMRQRRSLAHLSAAAFDAFNNNMPSGNLDQDANLIPVNNDTVNQSNIEHHRRLTNVSE